jgi:hypothetical protein
VLLLAGALTAPPAGADPPDTWTVQMNHTSAVASL